VRKVFILLIFLSLVTYVAYEGLIYFDQNFKYGRMRETPAVRPHEEAPLPMEEGVVSFQGGEAILKATKAEMLKSPFPVSNPDMIKQGKELYFTYCVHCHGRNYDGNSTVGQSFHPLPTDLRSQRVQALTEGLFFKEISYGIPNGRQPPLATTINIEDRWRIIAFVKSLGARQ
jgi:mono/diheme cytochrome c family protein